MSAQIPTIASPNACAWATVAAPAPQSFPTILSGPTVDAFSVKVNKVSALLEVVCRYAFGAYCVLEGLTLSTAGGSLVVSVQIGLAAIDGIVPVSTIVPYTAPASQATVNLWLKQDGTVTHTLDSTPPVTKCVFLGQVTTNGSGVTAQTYEGVIYAMGGSIWRTLAAPPADSPPAGVRLFTQVGTDTYIWNGSAHKKFTLT